MFNWFLKMCASLFYTVVAYITNPVVALFADEDGELHGVLHYWQTWDNSTNPSDLLKILPSWLTDWYDGHYVETYDTDDRLELLGRKRWYTECINHEFTLLQKIKRYICRVYWLYRNSAYGFCFFLLGADYNPTHTYIIKEDGDVKYVRDLDDTSVFMYCNSKKIFWRLHWNIFLGYKLKMDTDKITHAMIANRIVFKIED